VETANVNNIPAGLNKDDHKRCEITHITAPSAAVSEEAKALDYYKLHSTPTIHCRCTFCTKI